MRLIASGKLAARGHALWVLVGYTDTVERVTSRRPPLFPTCLRWT
jgi:hypothetical protein